MSTSLSKLKSQIAKLQKQAATIESGIVARIKAEIAKHGLTANDLFGNLSTGQGAGAVRAVAKPKAAVKAGAAKASRAPKYADGSGNSWGGMGKRPRWIHDALNAGKSLDDFLVAGKKTPAAKTKPAEVKVAPAKKAKAAKKAAPMKRAAVQEAASTKVASAPVAVKRPAKAAAKKIAVKKPAKTRTTAAEVEPAQRPEA